MKKKVKIKILKESKSDATQDIVDNLARPAIKVLIASDYFKKAKDLGRFDQRTIEKMHGDLTAGIYRSATISKVKIDTKALSARVDSIIRKLISGYEMLEYLGTIDDQKAKKLKRDLQSLKLKKAKDKASKEQEKLRKLS